jgi:hypothetical protein
MGFSYLMTSIPIVAVSFLMDTGIIVVSPF